MNFDLGLAWNDGVAKVRDNFQILAIISGVFLFIPSAIFAVAMPDVMSLAYGGGAINPEDPAAILNMFGPGFIFGYVVMIVLSLVGYTAMMALMNQNRNLTVGEAIGQGIKSLPTLFGAMLLFLVGYFLFALIVGVIFGLVIAGLGAISSVLATIVAFVLGVALIGLILCIFTRLSMVLPVVAIEQVTNPITAITRSWSMTAAVQWRLLAFYALLFIAYMVIALLLFGVLGVIMAATGGVTVMAIISSVIGMVVAMFYSGILAAVHSQLGDKVGGSLTDTFD